MWPSKENVKNFPSFPYPILARMPNLCQVTSRGVALEALAVALAEAQGIMTRRVACGTSCTLSSKVPEGAGNPYGKCGTYIKSCHSQGSLSNQIPVLCTGCFWNTSCIYVELHSEQHSTFPKRPQHSPGHDSIPPTSFHIIAKYWYLLQARPPLPQHARSMYHLRYFRITAVSFEQYLHIMAPYLAFIGKFST